MVVCTPLGHSVAPVEIRLRYRFELHGDAQELAIRSGLGDCAPDAHRAAVGQLIADVRAPLPERECVVVVFVQKVVGEAPQESVLGALEEPHRGEALRAPLAAFDDAHHLHGVGRGVDGRADLDAERAPDRNAQVHRRTTAELGIDAEVLRLLAAVETDKGIEVVLPAAGRHEPGIKAPVVDRRRREFAAKRNGAALIEQADRRDAHVVGHRRQAVGQRATAQARSHADCDRQPRKPRTVRK